MNASGDDRTRPDAAHAPSAGPNSETVAASGMALEATLRDPAASAPASSQAADPGQATEAGFSLKPAGGGGSQASAATVETLVEKAPRGSDGREHLRLSALAAPRAGSLESRYTITKLHAQGGIGQVWVARDVALGRDVALKELKPDRSVPDDVWARFVEEARITGQLEHPGIAPVYELGRRSDDGLPYYTMKFIRGGTLADAIQAHHTKRISGHDDRVGRTRLLEAFVAVCNTVAYAHNRGVIHRDLKSQNVVLGDFGESIVLDWGLAKLLDRSVDDSVGPGGAAPASPSSVAEAPGSSSQPLPPMSDSIAAGRQATLDGQVMGTPAFMAPEQAAGDLKLIGRTTDIYGLGAILYEILTGRPPFNAGKIEETIRQVREERPVPPRQLVASTPPELEAIALKALSKAPSDRYPSALALAEEVHRFLSDEPVAAYPEPALRRAGRWARKHRAAVAAAVVLLVAGLVLAGTAYTVVRHQRNLAREQRAIAQQAVETMYTDVAEQWLEDTSDPVQRAFLEEALAYYTRFADSPAAGPFGRFQTAHAYQRVGDVHRKLGAADRAEPAYRQALARLVPLADRYPAEPGFATERARTRSRLAALLDARGQREEAATLFEQARLELERLVARQGDDPGLATDLARTCRDHATLLRSQGRSDPALALLAQALTVLDPLTQDARSAPTDLLREQGAVLEKQGLILSEIGREAEAEAALERACNLLEPLQAREPHNPRVREILASTSDMLGRVLQRLDAADRAEPVLKRAVDHYEHLARTFPARPEYQRLQARGQMNLGAFYHRHGRFAEARRAIEAASATLAALDPEQTAEPLKVRRDRATAQKNLGATLETLGRSTEALRAYAQAVEAQQALVEQFPETPHYRDALAQALDDQARLLGQTDPEAAFGLQERACALSEALVAQYPEITRYQATLAQLQGDLGILLSATDPDGAEAAYRRAIARDRTRIEAAPDDRQARGRLARHSSNLAELRTADGQRLADAEALGREAVATQTALVEKSPGDLQAAVELATYELNLGEQLVEKNRPGEATTLYAQSQRRLETILAQKDSERGASALALHATMAYLQTNRGQLALQTSSPAEARRYLERAVAEQRLALEAGGHDPADSPELRDQLALLARATLETQAIDDAARTALELARTAPADPAARLETARLLAACADRMAADLDYAERERQDRARALGDKAIAQLRVALDAGFQPSPPLADDPELRPLATRDDFRALAAEAAAPGAG